MSIKICNFTFNGPFPHVKFVEERAGVYAVVSVEGANCRLLDVGESNNLKTAIANNPRQRAWAENSKGHVEVAVYYTSDKSVPSRQEVEKAIRTAGKPAVAA